jgi:hypothetical protein
MSAFAATTDISGQAVQVSFGPIVLKARFSDFFNTIGQEATWHLVCK